jgi:hypothetical protein
MLFSTFRFPNSKSHLITFSYRRCTGGLSSESEAITSDLICNNTAFVDFTVYTSENKIDPSAAKAFDEAKRSDITAPLDLFKAEYCDDVDYLHEEITLVRVDPPSCNPEHYDAVLHRVVQLYESNSKKRMRLGTGESRAPSFTDIETTNEEYTLSHTSGSTLGTRVRTTQAVERDDIPEQIEKKLPALVDAFRRVQKLQGLISAEKRNTMRRRATVGEDEIELDGDNVEYKSTPTSSSFDVSTRKLRDLVYNHIFVAAYLAVEDEWNSKNVMLDCFAYV